jgi:hypothetical protein
LVYYYNCNSQDDDIMLLMCNPLFILNDFHYLHDVKPASYIRPELLIIIIWARATSSEETENKTVIHEKVEKLIGLISEKKSTLKKRDVTLMTILYSSKSRSDGLYSPILINYKSIFISDQLVSLMLYH